MPVRDRGEGHGPVPTYASVHDRGGGFAEAVRAGRAVPGMPGRSRQPTSTLLGRGRVA